MQLHDGVKVLVVDVGVDPEQTLQNGLRHRHKITLKGHALGTKEREGKCFEKNTRELDMQLHYSLPVKMLQSAQAGHSMILGKHKE